MEFTIHPTRLNWSFRFSSTTYSRSWRIPYIWHTITVSNRPVPDLLWHARYISSIGQPEVVSLTIAISTDPSHLPTVTALVSSHLYGMFAIPKYAQTTRRRLELGKPTSYPRQQNAVFLIGSLSHIHICSVHLGNQSTNSNVNCRHKGAIIQYFETCIHLTWRITRSLTYAKHGL